VSARLRGTSDRLASTFEQGYCQILVMYMSSARAATPSIAAAAHPAMNDDGEVLLANPRGFCAGVTRAIDIVAEALRCYGAPVYVLHEIVHNGRVVDELRTSGAIFVESLADIPEGSVAIFSAHGVSKAVADEANARRLTVVDATCPLVARVHLEVVRHARAGRDVIMVGHRGHPEVAGTLGRYDRSYGGDIHLVESLEDVARLRVRDPDHVAVVTQTTLSMDETRDLVAELHLRFPRLAVPRRDDICYATQNRQNAVRQLSGKVDLLLVVGARNSSNSNRLREVGERIGVRSRLIEDASEVDANWLRPGMRVGITAGASTPEALVREVLACLAGHGFRDVRELPGNSERVVFPMPVELSLRRRAH